MQSRTKVIHEIFQSFLAIKRKLLEDTSMISREMLPPSQWVVLFLISEQEGIGVKEIARLLGMTSSAVTQLVNGLVKKEYLERQDALHDRRAVEIRLTKKAKKQLDALKQKHLERTRAVLGILTDEELTAYAALNKKIANSLFTF